MASIAMDDHEMWLVAVVNSYSVVPALMNRKEGGATPAGITCTHHSYTTMITAGSKISLAVSNILPWENFGREKIGEA